MLRFDLHCDTVTMLKKGETIEESHCKVSLENLKGSDTLVQCFAAFIPTGYFPAPVRKGLVKKQFERIYENYRRMLEQHPQELRPVLCAGDIRLCREEGKIGALLTLEDGGIMGDEITNVEDFYQKGVRLVTLTWNSQNPIGYPRSKDPNKMARGLKPYGFQVLEELERLGMAADVSHLSDGGFWDVIRHGKKPPLASHSNARDICEHPRNLTDDMIRALAEKGGIMGLNFGPEFLGAGKGNRVEDMVRHIHHILQVGGEDVIALGSDFDGIGGENEVDSPADCPKLYDALLESGLPESLLEKIWWKNAERYFREVFLSCLDL